MNQQKKLMNNKNEIERFLNKKSQKYEFDLNLKKRYKIIRKSLYFIFHKAVMFKFVQFDFLDINYTKTYFKFSCILFFSEKK